MRTTRYGTCAAGGRDLAIRCAGLLLALSICMSDGCRAQQPWPLWNSYADRMVDGQGRVVDRSAGDRTTSEGQAYGMFFALVADDRTRFDNLLHWTEANLAGGDMTLRLPAWSWGKAPDGTWKVLDPNPASDADLWMAYTLSEAGRLWREPRYEKLGSMLATRIAQQEVAFVPGLGITLLPSATGFHPDNETWLVNPSYLPPPLLMRLSELQSDGPWRSVLGSLQTMLQKGSGNGFAMDWIAAGTTIRPSLSPAQRAAGDHSAVPIGAYEAIRVYLWLGLTDEGTPGLTAMLAQLPGMAAYLQHELTPPQEVDAQGQVTKRDAPPAFSAAVIPYLHLLGRRNEERAQLTRLGATRDESNGLYGKQAAYYDQNLALFATGWTEQRYHFDRGGRLIVRWR